MGFKEVMFEETQENKPYKFILIQLKPETDIDQNSYVTVTLSFKSVIYVLFTLENVYCRTTKNVTETCVLPMF